MGKSALDATRVNAFLIEPERLTIVTDRKHPLYDERVNLPLDENLVRSMTVNGFKSVVIVRKNGEAIEVVDGRQRVRAAVEANKRLVKLGAVPLLVKVVVEKGAGDADLVGLLILSNEGRQDDSAMIRARKLKRLMDMGRTEEQAAAVFSKPLSWVSASLALLECAGPVQAAVERSQLSITAATKLAKLSREEQAAQLAELIASGAKVTVARVARKIDGKSGAPSKKTIRAAFAGFDSLDRTLENKAAQAALAWVLDGKSSPVIRLALASVPSSAATTPPKEK